MKPIRFVFLFLSYITSQAQTEKNVDHQGIIWTRYYNQLTLSKKWAIHSEFDNRTFINPVKHNLFVARLLGRYKLNEQLETGVGFAYFLVTTQDPYVDFDFKLPEYRGQQDITWKR